MSYSEEQQRAYHDVQYRLGEFDKLKAKIKNIKCTVHQKKCKAEASWEEDYHVQVFIEKYCCPEFAKQIAELFLAAKIFDAVFIKTQQVNTTIADEASKAVFTVDDYKKLISEIDFDEFPLIIDGTERKMDSFVPIERANLDLKIYICKVILKRCFTTTSGDLTFPWDYAWFIKYFFSIYNQDHLKPSLTGAIKEAYDMLQADKPFKKGVIASTFLFGVIEFYIKYELGFRPYDFDFFGNAKKTYYHKHFSDKKRTPIELSLGKSIELLLKEDLEIADAIKELEQHNLQRLKVTNIDETERWVYPTLSKRLSLYRNTMLHGEQHSFYSVGHYLLTLYCLFHFCREKLMVQTA